MKHYRIPRWSQPLSLYRFFWGEKNGLHQLFLWLKHPNQHSIKVGWFHKALKDSDDKSGSDLVTEFVEKAILQYRKFPLASRPIIQNTGKAKTSRLHNRPHTTWLDGWGDSGHGWDISWNSWNPHFGWFETHVEEIPWSKKNRCRM